MRGVAPAAAAAAARSMAEVELCLLLLPSSVGVYVIRKADPNESLDLALLLLEPFLDAEVVVDD